jgi:hypothetical protein
MKILLTLAVLSLPSRAAVNERAVLSKINGLVSSFGFEGAAFRVPLILPAPPQGAVGGKRADPLIPRSHWEGAQAPAPAILDWLGKRIPGLDKASVHEISYETVAAVISEAARRKNSTIDIFTDSGLRGDVSYYLSADTVKRLFTDFDLHTALQAWGKTTNGTDFQMVGIVMGKGAVHILYNLHDFDFKNAADGNKYNVSSRVTQTIEGSGRLAISGMWVYSWPVKPRIERLTKLGPGRVRVDTNYGSRDVGDDAVERRARRAGRR